ncbi:acetate/propionate family kinase [Oricola thermophila]|uniref:Acetate kinase n=1 Tax=Oricola thermophila TaxID=2742145 RepID=A0A6N1V997_9HYPH|nr:acetate/propionate family kinase [Oricola thermophila]QKV17544.1 acetate/propionate family kinase [Oricola thermophila]
MTSGAILTLNAGSSSIKFSIYMAGDEPEERLRGEVEKIGGDNAELAIVRGDGGERRFQIGHVDHRAAMAAILAHSGHALDGETVAGVGHRIVHGGTDFTTPTRLDDATVERLAALEPLAPLHQPHNLAAVRAARSAFPSAVQIACFDTAFHRAHPWVNDTFALPREWYERGVRRYGFHGLSYEYVSGEVARIAPELRHGRVVIAHLGNGASMCAVRDGRSIASTMGFTALDGLPMGTRCGQLDPGVLLYMMDQEKMTPPEISKLLYHESGLKGLSGVSHDMRELEASGRPEAAEAIEYFVFRIRRELGALSATLGGLDALVFTGGIGEHSALVRRKVCENMEWLGIEIDDERNADHALDLAVGRTRVMVVPTDEERVIARAVNNELNAEPDR